VKNFGLDEAGGNYALEKESKQKKVRNQYEY
jgi:hypothetical protein